MAPLRYHSGQIEIQQEANSRHVADKLAHWVGPVVEYALNADLVLLGLANSAGELQFAALSGPPPLVSIAEPGILRLHPALAAVLRPREATPVGGLVISLDRAERARINGRLRPSADGGIELEPSEMFTLCRKYMAPTAGTGVEAIAGPLGREPVALSSAWVGQLVASAQTAFLASVSPDGMPDVAHRGGPAGFLELDAAGEVRWPEWVGDGVFKSAGNIRATGTATLLVPDLAAGDALELAGRASYETLLFQRRPRTDPLLRLRDPFPIQGRMLLRVESARRLRGLAWPRRSSAGEQVTSCSALEEQAPA
jgi:uncharacterized protein